MEIIFLTVALLAVVIHIYIWILESFLWTKPATLKTFNITKEVASSSKNLAFNQGFYNLFLAVVAGVGVILFIQGYAGVGKGLVYSGLGSMVLASCVLLASDRTKLRPALIQFTPPAIALVFLFFL